MSEDNVVRIFDTTLRDGEQSPGASLTSAEKLEIARQLARLGVDIIEAGFPIASPDDAEGVRRIAEEVGTAAAFLCSPLASGITGETLHVDKGYHAMGMQADAQLSTE